MTARTCLTPEQREALFAIPTDASAMAKHYVLSASDLDLVRVKRRAGNRLGFALQLCLLRFPGQGLRADDVPAETMIAFVAAQLGIAPAEFADYARRDQTRREHAVELQGVLGLRTFRRQDWRTMLDVGTRVGWSTDRSEPVVRAMIEHLRADRVIVPDAAVLERIALAARARARKQTFNVLNAELARDQRLRLNLLLMVDPALKRSTFAWLRDYSESPAAANILLLLDRLDTVRQLCIDAGPTRRIHRARLARLVDEGAVMTAQHISDLEPSRRMAVLVVQIVHLETALGDAALAMFEKFMGSLFTKAKNTGERRFQASKRDVAKALGLFQRTIAALQAAKTSGEDGLRWVEREVGLKRLEEALPVIDSVTGIADEDILVTASERYGVLRRFVPRFLDAFRFQSTRQDDPVLAALGLLRRMDRDGTRRMPEMVPLHFLPLKWRKLIIAGGRVDRRLYETAVLAALRDRLRSGDIWIDGSRDYRAFEDYLLPIDAPEIATIEVEGTKDAASYLARRADVLHERLSLVAERAERGDLDGVEIEDGALYIARIRPGISDAALDLASRLNALLPRVRITEVLTEVDQWTGFSAHFVHLRSGQGAADKPALLAAILADGTNLGLSRMAEATRGLSYHHLVNIAHWHITEDNYAAARAAIVNAQHRHPLSTLWGRGTTSSSDGQYFRAGGRAGAGGEINAKYGIDPGVVLYTHVSDHYGPFHTKVISATASEAPHVLDGLLQHAHQTEMAIHEHYTDTAGATDHVFGLCHLLGFRFAPRIKDLKDRKLYSVQRPGTYPILEPLIGGMVDTKAIAGQWRQLQRLAASIQAGRVAPSVILRKLAAAGPDNALARALQAVGRIQRTLFTLNWLSDPDLRQRSHAGLNKGEASNALRRAIFFHRQGEIRDRTFENQSYRASGLSLITAAIVHWNTVYLDRAVRHLREQGRDVPDELVAHIAPLGWEHIALTGDYVWGSGDTVEGFRPVRDVPRAFQNIQRIAA